MRISRPNVIRSKQYNSKDKTTGDYSRKKIVHLEKSIFQIVGKYLVSVINYYTIKLWDTELNTLTSEFSDHSDRIAKILLSMDLTLVFSFCFDNSLYVWDIKTNTRLFKISDILHSTPFATKLNRIYLFVNTNNEYIAIDIENHTIAKHSRKGNVLLALKSKFRLK